MKYKIFAYASILAFTCSCGTDMVDRAVSGGAMGAGVGAVSGAAFGMPVVGALIGGTAGAMGGAATQPDQINLGKPIWR